MSYRLSMEIGGSCLGAKETARPDLHCGCSKRKCSRNATSIGNCAGSDDWHFDRIRDEWHQRKDARLRCNRSVGVRAEEHSAMTTGFIPLRDDHVGTMRLQPARFLNSGRGRHHTATGRLYGGEQCRLRQAKMKTHHFGPDGLDDSAHFGAEWRDIEMGPLQLSVHPELAVVAR